MPTRLFLDALTYHYIYLASPTQWDDPMETQYMNWLRNNYYQSAPQMARELLNYSVFATCFMMNNGINEEVLWNNYSHGSSMCVRVTIDVNPLFDELLSTSHDDGDLYISKIDYRTRKAIKTDAEEEKTANKGDIYINNFSMKQIAYMYEQEVRLSLLINNNLKDKSKRIEDFDWAKCINHVTLPPINRKMKDAYEKRILNIATYQQIKYINKDIIIKRSNLYDPDEDDMESQIIL